MVEQHYGQKSEGILNYKEKLASLETRLDALAKRVDAVVVNKMPHEWGLQLEGKITAMQADIKEQQGFQADLDKSKILRIERLERDRERMQLEIEGFGALPQRVRALERKILQLQDVPQEAAARRIQKEPSASEAVFLDARGLKVYGEPVIKALKTSEGVFLWTKNTLYVL